MKEDKNIKPTSFRVYMIMLIIGMWTISIFPACSDDNQNGIKQTPSNYYVDSKKGSDTNDGLSDDSAWQTISKVSSVSYVPGDTIKFKRGSNFNTPLYINDSGEKDKYIVLTSYGDPAKNAPTFTNTLFDPDTNEFGNCIRLKGSYIIVENLYFEHTVAELSGNIGFLLMWELGAIYIDKTATHCIVRNNEIFDCGVGIKSYGQHALITNNYIHDCNRILREWGWGPLAIWLGGDYQEVSYNKIFNYSVVDPRINWGPNSYGGGADGGAIEIDDGRVPKSHIEIHHNYSQDNQGFIEVTWTDVVQNPPYTDFSIHHNVTDDYQQFIALWCGAKCRIENNTVIRRKRNVCDWGIFNITQHNSNNYVRNNLVVIENDIIVFPGGKQGTKQAGTIISNNLYYTVSGELIIGNEGPGVNYITGDPLLFNYANAENAEDFKITASSPAIDAGISLGYTLDFNDTKIPKGSNPDIGAFEY
jgi:hypothetical protein